jgi:excisionase family DNA binding protein
MSNLMTETEVAKRLNVSRASLRRWRVLNRGPAFIKIGGLVRYRPEELEAWLDTLSAGAPGRNNPKNPDVETKQMRYAAS